MDSVTDGGEGRTQKMAAEMAISYQTFSFFSFPHLSYPHDWLHHSPSDATGSRRSSPATLHHHGFTPQSYSHSRHQVCFWNLKGRVVVGLMSQF
uniref:Uncharacterized protein n=1 Tax=Knipowitschia caucasica TaxID=637954 RepID=A0AAV2JX65_KNICA